MADDGTEAGVVARAESRDYGDEVDAGCPPRLWWSLARPPGSILQCHS